MEKQQEVHVFKGVQRDISAGKHSAELLYDGLNIRLTARENNTLLSVVNEKGTSDTNVTVQGTYLGHCLLNEYLVVFSTGIVGGVKRDYITRISLRYINNPTTPEVYTVLYPSNPREQRELKFCTDCPIQAIASYESENIQKVYWTDNYNQPRVINIAPYFDDRLDKYTSTSFDFTPELLLNETVTVKKVIGGGEFPSGVIQYAFTYYNKYMQESNIFYTTPLLYISLPDRAGSPEEKISNSFCITVNNVDAAHYDYLRIYSIHRSSLNGTPLVKRLQDIELKNLVNSEVSYTDTGNWGETVDPTELLYKSNEEIVAKTIEQKDGTLFLGGITIKRDSITDVQEAIININKNNNSGFPILPDDRGLDANAVERQFLKTENGNIDYVNTLCTEGNVYPGASCFKGGEYYRFGVQFQYKNGLWTEPCWIGDRRIDVYPVASNISNGQISVPEVEHSFGFSFSNENISNENILKVLYDRGYRKARPVFAVPTPPDRTVICQGITCPTLYRKIDRNNNLLYAQSSWVFRLRNTSFFTVNHHSYQVDTTQDGTFKGGFLAYDKEQGSTEDAPLFSQYKNPYFIKWEKGNPKPVISPYLASTEVMGLYDDANTFRIDVNTFTLHTPDLFYETDLYRTDFKNFKVYCTGDVNVNTTYGSIDIQTSSPPIGSDSKGFIKTTVNTTAGGAALVSGNFYEDYPIIAIKDNNTGEIKYEAYTDGPFSRPVNWPVFMWHKNGSLNNDTARTGQTAKLLKKQIINYRAGGTTTFNPDLPHESDQSLGDINDIKLFNSSELTIEKINGNVYSGNIDTIVTPTSYSPLYMIGDPAITRNYYNGNYYTPGINEYGDLNSGKYYNSNVWPNYETDVYESWNRKLASFHMADLTKTGSQNTAQAPLWKFFYDYDSEHDVQNHGWVTIDTDNRNMPLPYGNNIGQNNKSLAVFKDNIHIKYKSTPHLIVSSEKSCYYRGNLSRHDNSFNLVELRKTYNKNTLYGGYSEEALKALTWIPCGPAVRLDSVDIESLDSQITLEFKWGDSYVQQYECLKTYPYTTEDVNQVTEIANFIAETRINIDGRYDKNRGQISNNFYTPQNFNLINPVYSQMDNFFNYRILDSDYYDNRHYSNQLVWSLGKTAGADIDIWAKVNLASILELDGSKGHIQSLNTWKDNLYCFQDRGISTILFNSRVQISTSDGNPIEINNNYKTEGFRYHSEGVGCSDFRLIKKTPNGLYFIDSVSSHLFQIGEGLKDLSQMCNMTTWFKDNSSHIKKLLSDDINHDVYVVQDAGNKALCFSEKLGEFTGFYDYDDINLIEIYDKHVFTMKDQRLWKMFEGPYCRIFNVNRPWSLTFISNGASANNALKSKTFTNLEFRANVETFVETEGVLDGVTEEYPFISPIDTLEVWDEYQHGVLSLSAATGTSNKHESPSNNNAQLGRKFRIWRCDIPRDNYIFKTEPVREEGETSEGYMARRRAYREWLKGEEEKGVYRHSRKPLDRMKNPWLYVKLYKNAQQPSPESSSEIISDKTELNDVVMTYFI